jgi:chemotaxis protein MotA
MATYAPAMGMIGTLIGLVQMLQAMDDPSAIGPGMAVALITTFYGALMANLVYLPIAAKLKLRSDEEALVKEVIISGILAIQSGDNPRIVEQKLQVFIAPKHRTNALEEVSRGERKG